MTLMADEDGPFIELDFSTATYVEGGHPYASIDEVLGLRIAKNGGLVVTPSGAMQYFAPGNARIVDGVGLANEPASVNLLRTFNVAPTTIAGYALLSNRPAGANITVVDDLAALYDAVDPVSGAYLFRALIDQGVMNGNVVRLYNPSPDTNFAVPILTVGEETFTSSAYVRAIAGSGYISMTGGTGGNTPDFENTAYQRVGRTHVGSTGAQYRVTVRPQSEIYIILNQLEPGSLTTSPIITAGAAAARAADLCELSAGRIFGRPHTAILDVYIARRDGVERQLASLSNGTGEALSLSRGTDNALHIIQTGARWQPRVPRISRPGFVRFGWRTHPLERTLGCGGVLAHDLFQEPPQRLTILNIGSAHIPDKAMNGWIRSLRVFDDVGDDEFEQLVVPPADSMSFDHSRYIDQVAGDDDNDGRTPATAWKTLARAAIPSAIDASRAIPAGSHVWLKSGNSWDEALLPMNYCTYRPTGGGPAPRIAGKTFNASDPLSGIGIDENAAGAFRVQGILIQDTYRTGFNVYGGGGIVIYRCEFHRIGEGVAEAQAIKVRGNGRVAKFEVSPGTPPPAAATFTMHAITETAFDGTYLITCTRGGGGTASRWSIRRPDGVVHGTQAVGNTIYNSGGLRFTITDAGANPVVGEQFKVLITGITNVPYPTQATYRDFYIGQTYIHEVHGIDAGDDVYCEGVQGLIRCEGNRFDTPRGKAADCFQASRTTITHVQLPAHVICSNNSMDMRTAPTNAEKGCIVIIAGSTLIENNYVRGINFGIGSTTDHSIIRWNHVPDASLFDYSWGISGNGGGYDITDVWIYGNYIENCSRGLSFSGSGGSFATGPKMIDFRVHHNVVVDCTRGIHIDRPISGFINYNRLIRCTTRIFKNSLITVPQVGTYKSFEMVANEDR